MTPVLLAERPMSPVSTPIEDVTRRRFITGVGVAVLAATFLAACGSDGDDGGASSGTRAIEDRFGAVSVPARPQRVVAVRHHHIGNMLALGVVPVGIVADASDFPLPEHAAALAGVPSVRDETEWQLDIEAALALTPDLILEMSGQPGDDWNREMCDRAKAVATTACFPYGYTTEDELKQNLIDVGEALGLQEKASEIIAAYDARVAELRAQAGGFAGKPVANITWNGTDFFIPTDRPANVVLRTLGIPEPAFQDSVDDGFISWSIEELNRLDEAYAVVVTFEGGATPETLEALPTWGLLKPVEAGRVVYMDGAVWGWDYLPAMMRMLDEFESSVLPLADR